jgi:sterol desaturase/sphingolipid hydroxylase (fatty acid hydroxylase superfamily)
MAIPEPTPQLTPEQLAAKAEAEKQQRVIVTWSIVIGLGILALLATAIYFLLRPQTDAETVGKIRDVFIIVMALESLLIGAALVVLIVQVASLVNLLQNEVRPILQATTETVNNLRGTAEFLGENVVGPVIKLNGYLAGLQRVIELMGIKRK